MAPACPKRMLTPEATSGPADTSTQEVYRQRIIKLGEVETGLCIAPYPHAFIDRPPPTR
jgi:hypothetical protein